MRKLLLFTLSVFLVLVLVNISHAVTATLEWDAPTTRVDESALGLDEITKYTVYFDMTTPPLVNKIDIPITETYPSAAHMTYILSGLDVATLYYIAVTVTDQYGQESAQSNIVSFTTPMPSPPNPPTQLVAPIVGLD